MSTTEVNPGDYLFCREDEQLYEFIAFEGDNVRVRAPDGKEPVLPFKGKGYSFYVIPSGQHAEFAVVFSELRKWREEVQSRMAAFTPL